MSVATSGQVPNCPECEGGEAKRVMSAPNVLGRMGGLTPQEESEVKQVEEKMAAITPKSQIDQLQAHRSRPKTS